VNAFSYLNASGGWEFSGPSGGYTNRITGERMSAAEFNSQYLNPSYNPISLDYDWDVVATIESESYDLPINVYGRINTKLASNSWDDQFSWVNDDSPLVEGSGSSLRGVGGELGFDVLGSRLMVGVHIYTNEYKSVYNGTWNHTHEKYSGFNLAFGPFKLQLRYNWTNSYFENGFGLSFVNIQQNSRPTLSGISGTAYLFGGLSGAINFDAGSLMKTATEASNWYYENTGKPWIVSFH